MNASIWASENRESFEAYVFLREVLKYCENKPEVVDSRYMGFTNTGLKYEHETFGERNAVERFFSRLKERTRRFWDGFLFNSSSGLVG